MGGAAALLPVNRSHRNAGPRSARYSPTSPPSPKGAGRLASHAAARWPFKTSSAWEMSPACATTAIHCAGCLVATSDNLARTRARKCR